MSACWTPSLGAGAKRQLSGRGSIGRWAKPCRSLLTMLACRRSGVIGPTIVRDRDRRCARPEPRARVRRDASPRREIVGASKVLFVCRAQLSEQADADPVEGREGGECDERGTAWAEHTDAHAIGRAARRQVAELEAKLEAVSRGAGARASWPTTRRGEAGR